MRAFIPIEVAGRKLTEKVILELGRSAWYCLGVLQTKPNAGGIPMDISALEENCPFPATGLDRIVLTTSDFVLKDWSELTTSMIVEGSGEIVSRPLASLESGEELLGDRAWCREEWWDVALSHKGYSRIRLAYNPSRMDGASNLFPASGRQVARASQELIERVAAKGIEIDPADLRVSSLEVASPVLVDRPIEQYLDALEEWANPKYLSETHRKPGWLCFSNGSRSIQFYDKHLQMEGELKEDAPYRLRIESKAKKGRAVNAMGIDFDHLLNGYTGPAVMWHHDMMQNCIGGITE
jgi:hypothetical protein